MWVPGEDGNSTLGDGPPEHRQAWGGDECLAVQSTTVPSLQRGKLYFDSVGITLYSNVSVGRAVILSMFTFVAMSNH